MPIHRAKPRVMRCVQLLSAEARSSPAAPVSRRMRRQRTRRQRARRPCALRRRRPRAQHHQWRARPGRLPRCVARQAAARMASKRLQAGTVIRFGRAQPCAHRTCSQLRSRVRTAALWR